ncbi:hypothetical protein C4K26_2968 [Pseudomonas chlororaphis]|nr:hypothetical protein C4K26_2968 [Pseudomonas chlororaphis]
MAALGHAALKTGSECSCRPLHSASSPVFALPDLRSPTFRTAPKTRYTRARSPHGYPWRRHSGAARRRLDTTIIRVKP